MDPQYHTKSRPSLDGMKDHPKMLSRILQLSRILRYFAFPAVVALPLCASAAPVRPQVHISGYVITADLDLRPRTIFRPGPRSPSPRSRT